MKNRLENLNALYIQNINKFNFITISNNYYFKTVKKKRKFSKILKKGLVFFAKKEKGEKFVGYKGKVLEDKK